MTPRLWEDVSEVQEFYLWTRKEHGMNLDLNLTILLVPVRVRISVCHFDVSLSR